MRSLYAICAALPELLQQVDADLPDLHIQGLGFVQAADDGRALFAYDDAYGSAGYLPQLPDLPEAFRPRVSGHRLIGATDLLQNPTGLVESRLMHTWYAEEMRRP